MLAISVYGAGASGTGLLFASVSAGAVVAADLVERLVEKLLVGPQRGWKLQQHRAELVAELLDPAGVGAIPVLMFSGKVDERSAAEAASRPEVRAEVRTWLEENHPGPEPEGALQVDPGTFTGSSYSGTVHNDGPAAANDVVVYAAENRMWAEWVEAVLRLVARALGGC